MSSLRETNAKLTTKAVSWPGPRSWIFLPLFLAAFFAYVWLRLEPAVQHHVCGPFLILDFSYFTAYCRLPGGLVEYAASWLASLDSFGWPGALVFAAIAGVTCWLGGLVVRRISGRPVEVSPLVPLFFLLLLRNRCGSPALQVSVGLVLALAAATGWSFRAPRQMWVRWLVAAPVSLLLFYVAGFWPALLFTLLDWLREGLREKKWLAGLAGASAGPILAIVSALLLGFDLARILKPSEGTTEMVYALAAFLCLPGTAILLKVIPGRVDTEKSSGYEQRRRKSSAPHARTKWFQSTVLRRAGQGALLIAGSAGVWLAFNRQEQALAEIDYAASRDEYEKVVSVAMGIKSLDMATEVRLHLALFHTGRLAEDLFSFPAQMGVDPLPGVGEGLKPCRAQARTLVELGLVSDAEHLAHEALEIEGERPDLLRELARINVLKERPRAARIFLSVLAKMPVERAEARARLAALERDPGLSSDAELTRIRPLMMTTDLPHKGLPGEALLRHLLLFNPRNRMAFEYLMAHHLLTLDLKQMAERLGQLGSLGYAGIPRSYEEALLLYQQLTQTPVELPGRQIRPATLQKFNQFNQALKDRVYATPEGRTKLAREFGDTYWYYYYVTQDYLKAQQSKQASDKGS